MKHSFLILAIILFSLTTILAFSLGIDKDAVKWDLPKTVAITIVLAIGWITSTLLFYFWWSDTHDKQLNDIHL